MKKFKVLALDGGGIKGLYSAIILKNIEDVLKIELKKEFNLIAGTSTGSIVASALVRDIPIRKVIELYKTKGRKIFKKNILGCGGFLKSKYNNKNLKQILKETFGDTKMGEIEKPLMIIASDILNSSVYVHKSKYLPKEEYSRDGETKLSDAILSSCAAPTFFDPVRIGNGYVLADGGLWANNPSIIALTEAIKRFNKQIKDIKILSIGTGSSKVNYTKRSIFGWGFSTGWKTTKLIEYFLELSALSSYNMSQLLLGDNNYLRINSNINYAIDNIKDIQNLKAFADKCFLDNRKAIENFFKDTNIY